MAIHVSAGRDWVAARTGSLLSADTGVPRSVRGTQINALCEASLWQAPTHTHTHTYANVHNTHLDSFINSDLCSLFFYTCGREHTRVHVLCVRIHRTALHHTPLMQVVVRSVLFHVNIPFYSSLRGPPPLSDGFIYVWLSSCGTDCEPSCVSAPFKGLRAA